jgi:hypothetical protein
VEKSDGFRMNYLDEYRINWLDGYRINQLDECRQKKFRISDEN